MHIMKKYLTIIGIALFSLTVKAQTGNDSIPKELTREQKKAQKEAANLAQFKETEKLLNSQSYVLEAKFLSGRSGTRFFVPSSLNFISIDTTSIIIQIGSNTRLGYNGVGGVTITGKIHYYKVEANEKRKTFYVRMSMMGSTGSYDIFMNVNLSGSATATVTGLYPGSVIYDGDLVPLKEARIYKGRSSY